MWHFADLRFANHIFLGGFAICGPNYFSGLQWNRTTGLSEKLWRNRTVPEKRGERKVENVVNSGIGIEP
jgi:hypothetical protein